MLKSYGAVGWVGGPCDFSVSPSPFGLDFGTLDLDFGLGLDKYFYSKFHIILLFVLFDIFRKKFKNYHIAEARFKQTHFCSKKSYNVAG